MKSLEEFTQAGEQLYVSLTREQHLVGTDQDDNPVRFRLEDDGNIYIDPFEEGRYVDQIGLEEFIGGFTLKLGFREKIEMPISEADFNTQVALLSDSTVLNLHKRNADRLMKHAIDMQGFSINLGRHFDTNPNLVDLRFLEASARAVDAERIVRQTKSSMDDLYAMIVSYDSRVAAQVYTAEGSR